jgi:membrane peptidoglycan carboxypeptidase
MNSFGSLKVDDLERRIRTVLLRSESRHGIGLRLLVEVVIIGEDHRFYRHPGIDILSILRAIFVWVFQGKLSGASTLEQQLVRTLTGRYELTLRRKLLEMALAVMISRRVSKYELAAAYLEVAYFGHSANGLGPALTRLGYDLDRLSVREASRLAAMLKVPLPEFPSPTLLERLDRRARYIEHLVRSDTTFLGRVASPRVS